MNVDTVRPNEKIAEESEQIGRNEIREKIRSCGGERKMRDSTRVGAQRQWRVHSYNFINYRTQSQHVCDRRLAQAVTTRLLTFKKSKEVRNAESKEGHGIERLKE